MAFAYYARLGAGQKKIYDRSAAVLTVPLPAPGKFSAAARALQTALPADDRAGVERATAAILGEVHRQLGVRAARVEVLAVRPHNTRGELHGLYTRAPNATAVIQLWMRTAKLRRPAAFKTFLRTALHESGHHLDYEHFKFADSFHTEGFFARAEHLFKQILGAMESAAAPPLPLTP